MEDILGQLFEGELHFNFEFLDEVPEYQAAWNRIHEKESAFVEGLTAQQKALYESLMQQSLQNEHLLTVEAFRRGFSTAARLLTASL